ncbi:4'-phosphopantetheinyl transferase family protein [Streptomyces sp. Qhu_M48]|uniref:4'-phosphopantetheinyl transferase family protein n=1 Tax=Streptomyces sp. Qhu_M48 TaxID=3435889 RepID=UPI003F5024A5
MTFEDHPRPPGVETLWCGNVTENAPEAALHTDRLDAEETRRLGAFTARADRDAYLVAHVRLRALLAGRLATTPERVELSREPCTACGGPHGRPYVRGGGVHFSLSHTRELVVIALASQPVGVDVEAVPDERAAADLAPRMHPREAAEIGRLAEADRPPAVARCWTRKESLLKARGVGLNEDTAVSYVGAGPRPALHPEWILADLPVPPGFAAAVAVGRKKAAPPGC